MRNLNVAAALAVLLGGCAGPLAFSHPARYEANGALISGSTPEVPSATIEAAGHARVATAEAVRIESDAERIRARAHITESRVRLVDAVTPVLAECMRGHAADPDHGIAAEPARSLRRCVGDLPTLLALTSEDQSFLMGYYGLGGGMGYGYYFPGAGGIGPWADTASGAAGARSVDGSLAPDGSALEGRVERLEGATYGAVDMLHDHVLEGTGGSR